jgi:hypothetical protein
MGNYTLLADENSPYSKDKGLYKDFKAHLIYNILLNGEITFSDNQVMSSPNLRLLARHDAVIRTLFEEKKFTLAVRDSSVDSRGEIDIKNILAAFLKEEKIPQDFRDYDECRELAFIGQHAVPVTWSFDAVRANFTTAVKKIIRNEFTGKLTVQQLETMFEWIAAEELRDNGGLGRAFLQNTAHEDGLPRLPALMDRYGLMTLEEARQQLIICTDAVYLSNLPKTLGLNPIYANEHRASFDKIRDFENKLESFGQSVECKSSLKHSHFREGLIRLDLDDIHYIHGTHEFAEFKWLSGLPSGVNGFLALRDSYIRLNLAIERRIIDRFPEIKRSSPAPTYRQLKMKYGSVTVKAKAYGSYVVEKLQPIIGDVLSLCWETGGGPSIPGLGIPIQYAFDVVKAKDPHAPTSDHIAKMQELADFLNDQGVDRKILFEENMIATSSFDKEIVVR